MVGHYSPTLVNEDGAESRPKGEWSMSETSSLNPVSLMLNAFSVIKEDSDYMSSLEIAESSSLRDSNQKHPPCKTRSLSPNMPPTPTTADNTVQLSPTSSSSLSSTGFAGSSMPGSRPKPWKGFRSSGIRGSMGDSQPSQERNERCLQLAPHIRKQLEIYPLTVDSSSSNSLGDDLSISSSFVVASDALEITGNFVDSLVRTTTYVKPADDWEIHNKEKSRDSDQVPQIPREIVCVLDVAHEQRRRGKFSRLPRDDDFITLPQNDEDDDDDDLFEVSLHRGRTDTEEYEVVSL